MSNEAIIALGNIGPGAKAAVPELLKALEQPGDKDMNVSAIEYALGKIGAGESGGKQTLEGKLASKDDNVRLMGVGHWRKSTPSPATSRRRTFPC